MHASRSRTIAVMMHPIAAALRVAANPRDDCPTRTNDEASAKSLSTHKM